jgi:hypothetical protein
MARPAHSVLTPVSGLISLAQKLDRQRTSSQPSKRHADHAEHRVGAAHDVGHQSRPLVDSTTATTRHVPANAGLGARCTIV